MLARHERGAAVGSGWSIESFCTNEQGARHEEQYGFAVDRSPWQHVMCARQSGKTQGDDGVLFDNAIGAPRSTNLFLGLVGTGVRESNWFPIWKPLCDKYGIPAECHNEQVMRTTFPNGARAMFAGTDDLTNVRKYLGNRLANSVVVIDEAQDQPREVLTYILRTLLPPMLTPTSRVILSGVLPDVPAGPFLELAAYDPESRTGGGAGSQAWSHHEWGRAANVHTPEAMEQMHAYCEAHGIDPATDPQIQRDYFMRRIWTPGVTAYRYDASRDAWNPQCDVILLEGFPLRIVRDLPKGVDTVSIGIDPGGSDRFAIVATAWSSRNSQDVYHVAEWVTDRGARVGWDEAGVIIDAIEARIGLTYLGYDQGSAAVTLALFSRTVGRRAVKPVSKADLFGRVERAATLLRRGRAKVMSGSAVETDLKVAAWDRRHLAEGRYRWSSAIHPDAGDGWSYSLQPFFEDERPGHGAAAPLMDRVLADHEGPPPQRGPAVEPHDRDMRSFDDG